MALLLSVTFKPFMLSVIMLNVVMLSAIMLIVVTPYFATSVIYVRKMFMKLTPGEHGVSRGGPHRRVVRRIRRGVASSRTEA